MIKKILYPDEAKIIDQFIKNVGEGSRIMFDVGAGSGSTFKSFAEKGWSVFAFEPDADNRRKSAKLAKSYDNVIIDHRAVSNKSELIVPFYKSDISSGISGLSAFHPSHVEAGKVETITLSRFCLENNIEAIEYLKIDAEGYDLFVLQGLNIDRIKPKIIMCEFEDIKTIPLGYTFENMSRFLHDRGYHILISEWYPAIKRGGPHRWRKIKIFPCKLEDRNAWGNIIAVQEKDQLINIMRLFNKVKYKWNIGNIVSKYIW